MRSVSRSFLFVVTALLASSQASAEQAVPGRRTAIPLEKDGVEKAKGSDAKLGKVSEKPVGLRRLDGVRERILIFEEMVPVVLSQPTDGIDAREVLVIDARAFDYWVFRGLSTNREQRSYLESRLRSKLREVERAWNLTEPQVAKLWLAGQGDIKRFLNQVEEADQEFDRFRTDVRMTRDLYMIGKRLGDEFVAGAYAERSLLGKTLARMIKNEAVNGK